MSRKPDLTYQDLGLFTVFYPVTGAGEDAWAVILEQTDNTARVLSWHAPLVIKQLRDAGYTVHKAKPITKAERAEIDAFIDGLGEEVRS